MKDLQKRITKLYQERTEAYEELLRIDIEIDNLLKALIDNQGWRDK